ncbi:MAG: DNA-binding response regulator [Ignavibacteriales bacterium CG12_big_fil_rev_8_21_14_0_65_30_8]|nr:MAG: DNA-binding response regulator [Ignavibacteriales bacterium CG12_big_fil_rev_8_21_14_0_65_30_8]
MRTLIYIVEDDKDIAELIEFNLVQEGFKTEIIPNGDNAYEKIISSPPDLLLLDLMLPGLSGIEICKYIRTSIHLKDMPVIMLTARSQETDKIIGLKTGADDYIAKPFSIKELIARIHALLRRTKNKHEDIFTSGNLKIYFDSHRIICNKKEVVLTPKEFKILETLVRGKGRVFSRLEIIEIVWKDNEDVDEHTVNVNIKRLRDKLGECKHLIKTKQGYGYIF